MGLVPSSSVLCVTKLEEMAGSELGKVYVGYQRKFFHPEHGGTGSLGQWLWYQTWQSSDPQWDSWDVLCSVRSWARCS